MTSPLKNTDNQLTPPPPPTPTPQQTNQQQQQKTQASNNNNTHNNNNHNKLTSKQTTTKQQISTKTDYPNKKKKKETKIPSTFNLFECIVFCVLCWLFTSFYFVVFFLLVSVYFVAVGETNQTWTEWWKDKRCSRRNKTKTDLRFHQLLSAWR